VAHQLICVKKGQAPYQASLAELVETYLGTTVKGLESGRAALNLDFCGFAKRPLAFCLLKYAALGVFYLPRLALAMSCQISPEEVIKASEEFVLYRHLNEAFPNPKEMNKKGTVLEGVVVVRNPEKIIFKLNSDVTGIVCTPAALKRFQDVQY
ncbi:3'-5' exonuclease domain containing protein, related, partial [Eimeria tenella]